MINSTINPSNLIWIFNVNFLMGTLAVVEPSVSWPIDYFKSPKAKNKPFFLHNRFPGFSNTGMQAFLFYEGRSVTRTFHRPCKIAIAQPIMRKWFTLFSGLQLEYFLHYWQDKVHISFRISEPFNEKSKDLYTHVFNMLFQLKLITKNYRRVNVSSQNCLPIT